VPVPFARTFSTESGGFTWWLEVFAQHRKVDPNFNPEVGFLGRTDCICDYVDVNFKPRPKIRGGRDLNFESFLFHAPDAYHVLQTQEWQGTFRIDFHDGAYSDDDLVDIFIQRLATPFNIYKNVFIPAGEYHLGPTPVHLRILSEQSVHDELLRAVRQLLQRSSK
jgi:hypothetical protein